MLHGLYEIYRKGLMRHVEKAARAPCHIARSPWDMLQGLHEIYCKGLITRAARADVTCCEDSM